MTIVAWYALRTKSRHEHIAARYLKALGYEEFLPTYASRRQWHDRVKVVELPLFSGYLFCRIDARALNPVLSAPGVVGVVRFGSAPMPVPAEEIEAVRKVLQSGLMASPCPWLKEGMRVKIRSGPLKGIQGRLEKIRSNYRLVLSVDMLQRSIMAEVDPEIVEELT